jgi:DNA-binding CsgD family transcriptional regulator
MRAMMVRMGRARNIPDSPPGKRPDVRVAGALPPSLTTLVGRSRELDELRSLFLRLDNESPNLRAAIDNGCDRAPGDVLAMAGALGLYWRVRGHGAEGIATISLELTHCPREDANAFVVSLDPGRTWFRYHHLLSDFLRLELRRTLAEEVPALHRRAAAWFTAHGQVADAIRHTQAAGDWAAAARLLARHSFSMMLDGQAQTIQALLQTFPPGMDHPGLALVRAMSDHIFGRLDEEAAHLAVAEAHAATVPPDDRYRLDVAIAALKVALARRRGHLASVLEQVRFLSSPALITLTGTLIWTGEFDEGERWLQRALRAWQADTGPDIGLLLHHSTGMLLACRGRHLEALPEFSAASRLQAQLAGPHALASQVTGWLLATQARLGRTREAHAALAALDDERAGFGEIRNARAVICLADGDPAGALRAVREVLDGTAPVIGYVTTVEAQLLAGLAHRELGDQHAANQAAERALSLAEADRLVLPFAMTSARDLLEALPHGSRHGALRADILDVLRGSPPRGPRPDPAPPAEQLSPGELRVLRFLPTNLSRPQIARELSVSLNTVSTHIRSIYAKLAVRDRSAAVQRARDLRLLAAGRTLNATVT